MAVTHPECIFIDVDDVDEECRSEVWLSDDSAQLCEGNRQVAFYDFGERWIGPAGKESFRFI